MIRLLKTFGKDWGGPICQTAPHDAIPLGAPCAYCGEPFISEDFGLVVPHFGSRFEPMYLNWHLSCFVKHLGFPT